MEELIKDLNQIPTPYNFVQWARGVLEGSGYVELKEECVWSEIPDMFFVTRTGTSIIAMNKTDINSGIIFESSSGIPSLKITKDFTVAANCEQVGVDESGESAWWSWLDRDLTLAGAVFLKGCDSPKVINLQDPVAMVPSLAIHLAPGSGTKGTVDNKQLKPVFRLTDSEESLGVLDALAKLCDCDKSDIVSFDLSLVPTDPVELVGLDKQCLVGYGLDSKLGSVLGLKAFIEAGKPEKGFRCITIGDAVFSSMPGPNIPDFLLSVLTRIGCTPETYRRSFLLSNRNLTTDMTGKSFPIKGGEGVFYQRGLRESYQADIMNVIAFIDLMQENELVVAEAYMKHPQPLSRSYGISAKLGIQAINIGVFIAGLRSVREAINIKDFRQFQEIVKIVFTKYMI